MVEPNPKFTPPEINAAAPGQNLEDYPITENLDPVTGYPYVGTSLRNTWLQNLIYQSRWDITEPYGTQAWADEAKARAHLTYKPWDTQEDALNALVFKKKQEVEWGRFFHQDLSPDEFVEQLPVFADWIATTGPFATTAYEHTAHIKPQLMQRSILRHASRAIKDPAYLQPIADFYKTIKERGTGGYRDKVGRRYGKFYDLTQETLGHLANENETRRAKIEDPDSAIDLADWLTEAGVLDKAFWYRHGVRKLIGPPNQHFTDVMLRRLAEDSPGKVVGNPNHGRYYTDAFNFVRNVLRSYCDDPNRNRENAQGMCQFLDNAVREEQTATFKPFLVLASSITKRINETGSLTTADGEIQKLEDIGTTRVEFLPKASLHLLYATRGKNNDPAEDARQAEQDALYANVVSWIIVKATDSHDDWYMDKAKKVAEAAILHPGRTSRELHDLVYSHQRKHARRLHTPPFKAGRGILS